MRQSHYPYVDVNIQTEPHAGGLAGIVFKDLHRTFIKLHCRGCFWIVLLYNLADAICHR